MTYSIVARDPDNGALGVAVQSHWFAVGSIVTWAEPGVGAIATQAFAEPAYGRRGLARLRDGEPAPDALAALLLEDAAREVRQVAFVDAAGRVAVHTGAQCIEHAGHVMGDGWSVQANMMANAAVVPAMAEAWGRARGDLAVRLLSVLDAAQAAGGDVRGMQSAAILVVGASERLVDVRVDDSPDPLGELRRLVTLGRVYDHMNAGDRAVELHDLPAARDHYRAAAAGAPERLEVRYWQAVSLAVAGDVDGALPLFADIFAADPRWRELTRRLQKPGIVPSGADGDALIARIVAVG